jgi:two-component system sensor histidine kinase ChiS
MTPQENFNFINSYMKRVGPVIRDYNGFIDKYIGDAIMALFPETPENAVQAAIAMQKQVSIYNMHRGNSGYAPISIGIGLHTGNLMLGTIGEEQRMETTVISDAVNLASRLEGLTKFYGAGIVISENTLNYLPNRSQYSYRFLDRVKVKGKNDPLSIFEIYEGDAPEIKHLKDEICTAFERAISLYYQQNFIQAKQTFQEILEIYPQDKATILYIKRCDKYQTLGTSTNWDGVEALDEK